MKKIITLLLFLSLNLILAKKIYAQGTVQCAIDDIAGFCTIVIGTNNCEDGFEPPCQQFSSLGPGNPLNCNGLHQCIPSNRPPEEPPPPPPSQPTGNCVWSGTNNDCYAPTPNICESMGQFVASNACDAKTQAACNSQSIKCVEYDPDGGVIKPGNSTNPKCKDIGDGIVRISTAIGCIPVGGEKVNEAITKFLEFILLWSFGISGGAVILFVIYGGYIIITSSGDPKRIQLGREIAISSISGLIMLLFSIYLLRIIGIDILGIIAFGS